MPHNMGSLFWHQRCGGCFVVQYRLHRTMEALQYTRAVYSEILSARTRRMALNVFVVLCRLQPAAAQLNLSLLDFEGNKFVEVNRRTLRLRRFNSSRTCGSLTPCGGKDPKEWFCLRKISGGKRCRAMNTSFSLTRISPMPRANRDGTSGRARRIKVTLSAYKFCASGFTCLRQITPAPLVITTSI